MGSWRRLAATRARERSDQGPSGLSLLPWLLMGVGAFSHLLGGEAANPWIGGLGLFTFNTLYIAIVFRSFHPGSRETPLTWGLLGSLGALTFALAIGYGREWLLLFPLLGLAVGAVVRRGKLLTRITFPLVLAVGVVTFWKDDWDSIGVVYGTFISVMVTAAILALDETVRQLQATREELARAAVEKERLRFSRDLHDLLGHTLSVIVVKSEVVRRLAPHDLDAALAQVADIESVGLQALTEIRRPSPATARAASPRSWTGRATPSPRPASNRSYAARARSSNRRRRPSSAGWCGSPRRTRYATAARPTV